MFESTISKLVFLGISALFAAVGLLWLSTKVRANDELARRLGQMPRQGDDQLAGYRDQAGGGISHVLAESGLGWSLGMFVTRLAIIAVLGLLFGVAIGSLGLGVVMALIGGSGLWVLVRTARARRLAKCDDQLPQALEIMAMALRAGHPLPQALELVATEVPAPLCHEFRRASDELALGRPMSQVLDNFGAQLPGCEAVNTFVVACQVLQETGGNIIAVLDRIVENARARSGYRARLRALTAEGRQSAKLLGALPLGFAVLAMATDDNYADTLLHDSGGQKILIVAGALWLLGLAWTRRLVRPMT
jgi:tight adherence protein B